MEHILIMEKFKDEDFTDSKATTKASSPCLAVHVHSMNYNNSVKLWQGKSRVNQSFKSFGEENFGKFTIA